MSGVSDALSDHKDGEPKGIKAHFRMDESGLLKLDYVRLSFILLHRNRIFIQYHTYMYMYRCSQCLSIQMVNQKSSPHYRVSHRFTELAPCL